MDLRVSLALSFLAVGTDAIGHEALLELRSGPALCTAAWVGDSGDVVTAYHCVVARRSIALRDRNGGVWTADRVHLDRERDLALLRVQGRSGADGLVVRSERLSVGDRVEVWGHGSASAGAGVPALDGLLYYSRFGGEVSAVGTAMTQLDVAFNPGVSGGPVLDEEGRIAAVASRKMKGEHLSFASPLWGFWSERDEAPSRHWFSGSLNVRLGLDLPSRR